MSTKKSKEFAVMTDPREEYDRIVHMLNNKYYNIYRSNFRTKGLSYREEQFVMNKFWGVGTIAAWDIKHAETLGFANWMRHSWDMYGEPEQIRLINEFGSPLVPTGVLTVDKDVVIGYIQSNRKPLSMIVNWYVERIAQVEMIINTNLQLQKMPFIIPVADEDEAKKMKDVVQRILNNELVLFVDGIEPSLFKSVATNVPYVIDKLQNYKKDLENDLLTFIGVNNSGSNKVEQLQLAEVNSNNEEINLSDDDFDRNLKEFCKRVKEVLGRDILIEVRGSDAEADGVEKEYAEKTGPKAEEEIE